MNYCEADVGRAPLGGRRKYLWRAVDDEGEVLDLVVQRRRDTEAALRLLKRLLHNQSALLLASSSSDRQVGVLNAVVLP